VDTTQAIMITEGETTGGGESGKINWFLRIREGGKGVKQDDVKTQEPKGPKKSQSKRLKNRELQDRRYAT